MNCRTIYVPNDKQEVFKQAQKLLGERSISATIIAALEEAVEKRLNGNEMGTGWCALIHEGRKFIINVS